jgi:DNA-binding transcriptional regulator YhcF (GntR family)
MSNSELHTLFAKKELDFEGLKEILAPYLRIDPENKQIYLLPDFSKLRYKDGVIIVLLGIKALKEAKLRNDELIGPTEVVSISKINPSTVKNALRELVEERIAVSEKGKYMIPNFVIEFLRERFRKLKEKKKEEYRKISTKRRGRHINIARIDKILKLSPEEFAGKFYDFLVKTKGNYLKKALVVITLAKEKCGIDGLTAAEITKILQEHIRVPRIHHPNITTALGSRAASEYVYKLPTKSKKVYLYKLTKSGEDFVNKINFHLKEER